VTLDVLWLLLTTEIPQKSQHDKTQHSNDDTTQQSSKKLHGCRK